jgi:pyruvate formate lyase activating enzyme
VFFHACSFNCLYCQNWHFRQETVHADLIPVEKLVSNVNDETTCICYFGGDPSPQIPYSLEAARLARADRPDDILRICWETNGSMQPVMLERMMAMALSSGGCIKFDLKAFDEPLHRVLTGVSNHRTLQNFKQAAGMIKHRPVPPSLIASTLMVSGYIDHREVRAISDFVAAIDPKIPYNLLAFYPQFMMSDLPQTSREQAYRCLAEARKAGLKNVRLGNEHLLQ